MSVIASRACAGAVRLLVSALIVGAVTLPAHAQTYPDRAVRIVVPFAPGGSTDIVARTTSQKLAERLRQSVVIDNRGGGGGNIGSDQVAKAPPDGYTLLLGTVGSLTINPTLYRKMPYDPLRDLAPIGYFGSAPNILVVHPSLPPRSVRELIAFAKSRPGQLNYASGAPAARSISPPSSSRASRKWRWCTCPTKARVPR